MRRDEPLSEIIKAFNEQNPHFAIEENPEADVLRRMLREQRELINKIRQQEKERVEELKDILSYYRFKGDNDGRWYIDIAEEDFNSELNKIFKLEE